MHLLRERSLRLANSVLHRRSDFCHQPSRVTTMYISYVWCASKYQIFMCIEFGRTNNYNNLQPAFWYSLDVECFVLW